MINLPDFQKAFEHENNFYWSSAPTRMAKLLAHYELYKMVENLPGAIVECGVFKGASLIRLATFRELFSNAYSKKIIGFDIFGKFPETEFTKDKIARQKFIDSAGEESISQEQLQQILIHKRLEQNLELVAGDICETIPNYLEQHPELKISLLNLDTDIYEPAVVILEHLFPRIVKGGILILDDYGVFPGETKAVDEYFANFSEQVEIQKFPFCMTPSYIVKK
jgi:Macrocin-O-methyltransferase (TylF)